MVRAILDGSKVQTRRVIKPSVYVGFIGGRGEETDPRWWGYENEYGEWFVLARNLAGRMQYGSTTSIPCPYGVPGDRLWVRETWAMHPRLDAYSPSEAARRTEHRQAWYRATHLRDDLTEPPESFFRWRPSIHMPRWASRLTLEVTDVRVERVQDISEGDVRAEGVRLDAVPGTLNGEPATLYPGNHRQVFVWIWDRINAARGYAWKSDPWVWAITFRRVGSRTG